MQLDQFSVSVNLYNKQSRIEVAVQPTTDDADTYVCTKDNEEITQIRKDSGKWKQLWGELQQDEIDSIGNAIDKILEK